MTLEGESKAREAGLPCENDGADIEILKMSFLGVTTSLLEASQLGGGGFISMFTSELRKLYFLNCPDMFCPSSARGEIYMSALGSEASSRTC